MPLISLHASDPLADGRQSDRALLVRRGVMALFFEMRWSCVPELTLASGRRADLVGLSPKGEIWIVEIKSSVEDFRADTKWPDYRDYADKVFFASHPGVDQVIFPQDAGFILADGHGAEIVRSAPEHRLAAARRKAMTLRIARFAADRAARAELGSTWDAGDGTSA